VFLPRYSIYRTYIYNDITLEPVLGTFPAFGQDISSQYKDWATGWTSGVQLPAGHRVQADSGAHPASNPMGTEGSFPGSKAAAA